MLHLLHEFGNLDNILANAEKIKKPSIRESVVKSADKLRTNYKLIKLGNSAILLYTLHEQKYDYAGMTTNEVLQGRGLK